MSLGRLGAMSLALAALLSTAAAQPLRAQTAPAPQLSEADAAAAKRLYMTRTCIACHGRDGKKAIQEYPDLAGQRADYMLEQIKDILDGKRLGSRDGSSNPRAKGMQGALIDPQGKRRITDEEASLIVRWLATLDPRKADPPPPPLDDAKQAQAVKLYAETCEACHGKTGREALEGFPVIAGQKREYLLAQLKDIKMKERRNGQSEAMQAAIADLKDDQIELLAQYVAGLDPSRR